MISRQVHRSTAATGDGDASSDLAADHPADMPQQVWDDGEGWRIGWAELNRLMAEKLDRAT